MGRPKKVKIERFKPKTLRQLAKELHDEPIPGEPPRLKYHEKYKWHGTPKAKQDLRLSMDNLKDYPTPPTQQALDEHNEWLATRKAGHRTAHPSTLKVSTDPAHYLHKYGALIDRRYQLSSGALSCLRDIARQHYYGRKDWYLKGRRQADLSKFIRALANPTIVWQDTRPTEYKDSDPLFIAQGTLPHWIPLQDEITTPRIPRKFRMTEQTEQALYKVALSHGIVNWRKTQQLKVGPTVSYLLEVIGHGYLTPVNMPNNPEPATSYPRRHLKYVF